MGLFAPWLGGEGRRGGERRKKKKEEGRRKKLRSRRGYSSIAREFNRNRNHYSAS